MPTDPGPPRYLLPDPRLAGPDDLVAVGGELDPATVLDGYRKGLFPMHVDGVLGWWSPARRGVMVPAGLRVSRSLRRSVRRYRISFDSAFDDVVAACADPSRPHGWIGPEIQSAYRRLHRLGWAHSVETWDDSGRLVGGLYGIAIGGLFAGESMFHRATDASKVALVALAHQMIRSGMELIDVQWVTDHLAALGAVEVMRAEYLDRLARAVDSDAAWLMPVESPRE